MSGESAITYITRHFWRSKFNKPIDSVGFMFNLAITIWIHAIYRLSVPVEVAGKLISWLLAYQGYLYGFVVVVVFCLHNYSQCSV